MQAGELGGTRWQVGASVVRLRGRAFPNWDNLARGHRAAGRQSHSSAQCPACLRDASGLESYLQRGEKILCDVFRFVPSTG
jgi:hypothetical protein